MRPPASAPGNCATGMSGANAAAWLKSSTCLAGYGLHGQAFLARTCSVTHPAQSITICLAVETLVQCSCQFQVVLNGISKSYPQGYGMEPVAAIRGLWLRVWPGECFGLLGVNGAGKTTTFKVLTGEVRPDSGDAAIAGHSVVTQLAAARRRLGYCPQFEALPAAMTGREVLHMYAALRGVRGKARIADMAQQLLEQLGLLPYANVVCGAYSGGNKRKLSVAVALVGGPPLVLLDEPSTGMDPAARRFLWRVLQVRSAGARGGQVIGSACSLLTEQLLLLLLANAEPRARGDARCRSVGLCCVEQPHKQSTSSTSTCRHWFTGLCWELGSCKAGCFRYGAPLLVLSYTLLVLLVHILMCCHFMCCVTSYGVCTRCCWRLQSQVLAGGRTIIITTHSMEEVEALASRLSIMTAGAACCVGTPQHLKNKFGDGYTLELRINPAAAGPGESGASSSTAAAVAATEAAEHHFTLIMPGAVVLEKEPGRLLLRLPLGSSSGSGAGSSSSAAGVPASSDGPHSSSASAGSSEPSSLPGSGAASATGSGGVPVVSSLADVFEAVEASRQALGITEYSLSQSSLERVFLSLAKGASHAADGD